MAPHKRMTEQGPCRAGRAGNHPPKVPRVASNQQGRRRSDSAEVDRPVWPPGHAGPEGNAQRGALQHVGPGTNPHSGGARLRLTDIGRPTGPSLYAFSRRAAAGLLVPPRRGRWFADHGRLIDGKAPLGLVFVT